jgi:hypothetical protein
MAKPAAIRIKNLCAKMSRDPLESIDIEGTGFNDVDACTEEIEERYVEDALNFLSEG